MAKKASEKSSKKNPKKEKLIVSEDEVQKDVEDSKEKFEKRKKEDEEEPNWYHYVIVLAIVVAIFAGLYFVFEFFYDNAQIKNPALTGVDLYEYEFRVDGANINMQFYNEISDIKKIEYPIEITKEEFRESTKIYLSFLNYSGVDNGEVVRTSGRMAPFVKGFFNVPFNVSEHLVRHDDHNCENSTVLEKVVVFDPYSDKNGVFYDQSNGCVTFETNDPAKMRDLGDKFFLEMLS